MIRFPSLALLYAVAALALGAVLQCQAASEADFVDALKTFQQARGGEDRQIEPAIAAFDALARAEPQQPAYAAYLGSALALKAREAGRRIAAESCPGRGSRRVSRGGAKAGSAGGEGVRTMTPAASAPMVRLMQVRKTYRVGDAEVQALRGVSLDAGAGELVALTGPSGSGKSTLLNICGLIDAPDAGEREINGMVVNGCAEAKLTLLRREKVGFIFQSFNLVPVMTVFDNVEYPLLLLGIPAPERRRRVRETLARVGLAEFERRLPDALSGGQRQRVAIARALVKSPSLVIADAPTGNLDSATATQIIELLRGLTRERGVAAVVATHDDRMTSSCDRVLRLVDGELQ